MAQYAGHESVAAFRQAPGSDGMPLSSSYCILAISSKALSILFLSPPAAAASSMASCACVCAFVCCFEQLLDGVTNFLRPLLDIALPNLVYQDPFVHRSPFSGPGRIAEKRYKLPCQGRLASISVAFLLTVLPTSDSGGRQFRRHKRFQLH